ncbi:outer membrane beta-barrel protein [Mucilaginibacter sp.]
MNSTHPVITFSASLWFKLFIMMLSGSVLLSETVEAQQYGLSGRVTDQRKRALQGVTIKIFALPDTLPKQITATYREGRFLIKPLPAGNYRLQANSVGYIIYNREFRISYGTPAQLPDVILAESNRVLAEVQVNGKSNPLSLSKGKLTYNVEQSIAASGSTALEVLRRMPGISIDATGNVQLKGSAAVNVMLDGKMTYLSGQQLAQLLEGMPSSSINKIEIINTPGAQYDASGNAGIINIVSRKSAKLGYAANINAGLTVGRYLVHNESFTGNIRTSKFNFFGGFGFSYRNNFQHETSRQFTPAALGSGTFFDRDGISRTKTNYYSFKAGVDLYLKPKHTLGFVYTGIIDDWSKEIAGTALIRQGNSVLQSKLLSNTQIAEPYYNDAYNLNYQFKIDTTGTLLTADADYIDYSNNSDGFSSSNNYSLQGLLLEPYQQLNFHQPTEIHVKSLKIDFIKPLKQYILKAGLKYASARVNSNFRYDSLINQQLVYAASLSNHFIYTENVPAAYFNIGREWKTTSAEVGLRGEYTDAKAASISTNQQRIYNYLTLFPTLNLTHTFNTDHKLDLSASRRINRPYYNDINPARHFLDRYAVYQGNPNLIAETSWIASLGYTWKQKYILSLNYNRDQNFISRYAIVDPATQVLTTNLANFPHRDRLELQAIVPYSPLSFWDINSSVTLSYTSYPLQQMDGDMQARKVNLDLSINQTFRLPGNIAAELLTRYTTPELIGVYVARYYLNLSGGFKKSFLNNKLDTRFAFADLLHTGWFWGYSISNTAAYSYKNTPDSRRFSLTFTYRLGGKLNTGKPHRTEEQNRL